MLHSASIDDLYIRMFDYISDKITDIRHQQNCGLNIFSMFLKICCNHFRSYLKTISDSIGYVTFTFSIEVIFMFDVYMYFQCDSGIEGLKSIAVIMRDSDVSPFEIIHSGLIQKLLQYLTSSSCAVPRDVRIRRFLHIFLNCPVSS